LKRDGERERERGKIYRQIEKRRERGIMKDRREKNKEREREREKRYDISLQKLISLPHCNL